MAEETRRSGRANKGQHTKNQDSLDEPAPAPKTKAQLKAEKKTPPKGKAETARAQSAQSADQEEEEEEEVKGEEEEEEEEEEEDAVIRCVCGDQRDIRGREMICCDSCEAWQHNKCLSLPEGGYWENRTYYCERCRPQDHQELLAAMARGEKPWARKKGSKPRPRPSDVKQEESAATPAAEDTRSQTPGRNAAETPTPAAAPAELHDNSNGHAEVKDAQSQPQSPTGEKRRHDTTTEKANKKRRKSSQHPEKAAAPAAPTVADIEALSPTQKPFAEKLRDTFAPLITAASKSRGYRIPDGETANSLASRIALQVSQATAGHYGHPAGGDSPYSQRVRAIMFNAKKNAIMIDRILSGSLKAEELATMPIEEMASEDKQKENAAIREAALKQSILLDEAGPRLRKTHKGEEIVGEDNMDSHEFKQPVLRERESISEDVSMQSPVTSRPPESPADQHRPSIDTSGQTPDGARRPSTNFDIKSVFDKVRSPQHDQQTFLLRRQSSLQSTDKILLPVDDADVDRLLKDEDNDTDMVGYSSDPSVCWHGAISMQGLQPFDAVARHVAGGDFGQVVPWDKLITNTVSVHGRIERAKGDEYIQGIATSDTYDVAVLSLSPVTSEARAVMDHFYAYFHSRGRWGVVPVENMGGDVMRDLYVIPIEAGGSNLPPFIDMLEHCTIETPRKEHMVLLALVAKLPEVKPPQVEQAQQRQAPTQTPQQAAPPANGPSPSPVNPHAPQYSPMAQNFPPQQYGHQYPPPMNGGQYQQPPPTQYQVPPHHQIPKAVEILGPYIDAPVVMQILVENLSKNEAVSEVIMANIRHIMDTKPAARTDMKSFTDALFEQRSNANANGGQTQAQ